MNIWCAECLVDANFATAYKWKDYCHSQCGCDLYSYDPEDASYEWLTDANGAQYLNGNLSRGDNVQVNHRSGVFGGFDSFISAVKGIGIADAAQIKQGALYRYLAR